MPNRGLLFNVLKTVTLPLLGNLQGRARLVGVIEFEPIRKLGNNLGTDIDEYRAKP